MTWKTRSSLAAVDDRRAGALALDGDGVAGGGQVEVALRRAILLTGGVGMVSW